jgi:hypothetical protein
MKPENYKFIIILILLSVNSVKQAANTARTINQIFLHQMKGIDQKRMKVFILKRISILF